MDAGIAPAVDLERYCRRIGFSGRLEPTWEVLAGLIEHHTAAIPFENIDVLLDRGVDISPGAVDAKLIASRRGGYCFEQNGLFARVLESVGFRVERLAARVLWMAPPGAPLLPRTHMALRVTVDEPWLVDVGFGGCVPTLPLRLADPSPQPSRHETFRLRPRGRETVVEASLDGAWRPLYWLSPQPLLDIDYEPANWFTSTHPASVFKKSLMAAYTSPEARWTLNHARLTIRRRERPAERHQLDAAGLEAVLAETFGLPVEPDWRPMLQRIAERQRPE